MISVSTAAFSPDKTKLLVALSAGFAQDGSQVIPGRLLLLDVLNGRLLWTVDAHKDVMNSLAFLPDSKRVLSAGGFDGTIKLWDAKDGALIRTFVVAKAFVQRKGPIIDPETKRVLPNGPHDEGVRGLALTPDGTQVLASCGDGKLRAFDLDSGHLVRVFGDGICPPIVFTPGGKRVLTGYGSKEVRLWDLANGEPVRSFEWDQLGPQIRSIDFSPDGTRVFVQRRPAFKDRKILKVWDLATGEQLWTLGDYLFRGGPLAFSPDGKFVFADQWGHAENARIVVREAGTGEEVRRFEDRRHGAARPEQNGYAMFMFFMPGGKQIFTVDDDATARLWDVASGKPARSWSVDLREGAPVFSADGKLAFVSSGANQTLSLDLWDVFGGKLLWGGRLWDLAGPESTMP